MPRGLMQKPTKKQLIEIIERLARAARNAGSSICSDDQVVAALRAYNIEVPK